MKESQKPKAKNQLQIKVCGLTKIDQIEELINLKVNFLGFIFYEKSPRFVLNHLSLTEIADIKHSRKVGVFVNESVNGIVEITSEARLDIIQLHGDENDEFILRLRQLIDENIQIIKVIRIGNHTLEELQKTINQQPITNNYLLFETDSKAFGGTGKTFDWNILNEIKIPIPYFLSGGISLENVKELENLDKVNLLENTTLTKWKPPFALDINSKFEIEPGNKDLEKIKKIISLVKVLNLDKV